MSATFKPCALCGEVNEVCPFMGQDIFADPLLAHISEIAGRLRRPCYHRVQLHDRSLYNPRLILRFVHISSFPAAAFGCLGGSEHPLGPLIYLRRSPLYRCRRRRHFAIFVIGRPAGVLSSSSHFSLVAVATTPDRPRPSSELEPRCFGW